MEILLGISLLANTIFIWNLVSNSGNKYTYEDIDRDLKKRDDEYRQLIFEVLKETYGNDPMKVGKEQGRFYEIGRRMKMFAL